MHVKLDIRSARVKGLCFHRSRPWVLCGLHTGVVQIWDYRMSTLVDTYSDHGGAVRGVDFHITQPLFCTGSDDQTVKVWNYVNRRCLYTLVGHMDYIRTTFFHEEQPWIISSSDDYTVRIWNWQSRVCIANLPAHHHYVMCARFHPTRELVISCSLDKTVRVWDIGHLRFRKQEAGITQDLLGSSDIQVTLQGEHAKGINWVAFNDNGGLFATASDDHTVVVWYLGNNELVKKFLPREHTDNVVCVSFLKDFVISCSEDRTVRVFGQNANATGYNTVSVMRRDMDRFWILSTLPSCNLIAAGHDTGLQVFKLFRERPPFLMVGVASPSRTATRCTTPRCRGKRLRR
ncbi:coatomer protein complex, subunit alpha (xenin) [Strigomonas culicis]|uniref:Coatomer protein complex, subunit alpha (Xenin) n=1 Tax=Strigomonas culicis TaxID=28005 RepID=S9V8C1_9TRYP|nr:coatomer protein complex, subunit alpha (xenin) [Strigomonas culicis]|eukprot:EPY19195.1 coatomer protein complex, subunit alpha (xenin) [Strigomonas culicis]